MLSTVSVCIYAVLLTLIVQGVGGHNGPSPALRIHFILTWIRILTFGISGSGSSDPIFGNSGSGSSDPPLEIVDLDPGPEWIRIRVPIFLL